MDLLTASGGWLDGCTIRLYKNDLTPGSTTVLSQFIECDFDGYAAIGPLVWGSAFYNASGDAVVVAQTCQFEASSPDNPNNVYGYYVTKGATGSEVYKFAERLATTYAVPRADDAVIVYPRFSLPNLAVADTYGTVGTT